jgi:hypothetical protein
MSSRMGASMPCPAMEQPAEAYTTLSAPVRAAHISVVSVPWALVWRSSSGWSTLFWLAKKAAKWNTTGDWKEGPRTSRSQMSILWNSIRPSWGRSHA